METRANYALIGLFTLAVITAGFLFVYWFSGGQNANFRYTYKVAFTGSVSGLGPGSLVTFNGIRVGEVRAVSFDPENPRLVIATIDISRDVQIRKDTRALLDVQIVSGVGSVALVGGSVDSQVVKPCPDPDCTIRAERSDFQDILESARIWHEEPFGPVALFRRFNSLEEACALANATSYGLASYAFTSSADAIAMINDSVEAGGLSINQFVGASPELPFGGVKDSGYGREGGAQCFDGYLTYKSISHKISTQ